MQGKYMSSPQAPTCHVPAEMPLKTCSTTPALQSPCTSYSEYLAVLTRHIMTVHPLLSRGDLRVSDRNGAR